MALPMLRGCSRFPAAFSFTRQLLNERVVLNRFKTRPPASSSPAAVAAAVRAYSSDRGEPKQNTKVMVVGIPNPFMWVRTRVYYFLIRTFFDEEFSIEEFTVGAKQAFSHVSRLLSQCQFEALEGLVAKDLIGKLEEKCNSLPSAHKKALSADPDEIMYTTLGDVGVYNGNGRTFISILMRFWYLTNSQLSDDAMEGARIFKINVGESEGQAETKRLLTAIYEFQREVTKGVPPEWTITRIEHSKLLD